MTDTTKPAASEEPLPAEKNAELIQIAEKIRDGLHLSGEMVLLRITSILHAALASRASSEPRFPFCDAHRYMERVADFTKCVQCSIETVQNATRSIASAEVRAGDPPLSSNFVQDLRVALCNVSQVFDGWHNDGTAWSEWDESVRKKVSELQQEIENYIRPDPASSRQAASPEGEQK